MDKQYLLSGVNVRMWSELKKQLQDRAKEIGITASTLARLMIERSLDTGDYYNVIIPENLLPSQEYRECETTDKA